MPKKGHTEEQIIGALKRYESGKKVAEICRKLGVSQASFYTWKKQYAGMGGPSDPAGDRLKKALKPRWRCRLARWTQEAYRIGARRSARLLQVPWATLLYKSRKKSQEPLIRRLREIAATHAIWLPPADGATAAQGWKVSAKRVYRLYDEENLKVRSVERKKIARRQRVPPARALGPNHCWSADFVSDKLADGRAIRILTVIEQFTRECVWLEADRSMNGPKVVAALRRAIAERGGSTVRATPSRTSVCLEDGWQFRPGNPSGVGSIRTINYARPPGILQPAKPCRL